MNDFDEDRVAVIGMAGRFPGQPSVARLWEGLRAGENSLTRWSEGGHEAAFENDYVPVKGYLSGAGRFREDLFGTSDAEAAVLDPQFRVLLETAWEALDDAGVATAREHPVDVGVFTSTTVSEHSRAAQVNDRLARELGPLQVKLLTDKDFSATRISYLFNLSGPSMAVQTACSSSLVAIHQAITSILLGECRVALAGGAAIDTTRKVGYTYYEGGIGSRTGVPRPFDTDADGAVGGNGAGLVVLKRLDDALQDGDHVHAVLLGSAIGNDGRAKVGFTAPSVEGHARTIAQAWETAGVDLADMGYFEAHGTGTRLGDPIEVAALGEACAMSSARPEAVIGSVKGNIGHLDTAAGVVGVIKAVCMLRERLLVPTPGLHTPDPELDLPGHGLRIQRHSAPFPSGQPMYIGVSSLGIGGTNAHVVLGEAPEPDLRAGAAESGRAPYLLPLSTGTSPDMSSLTASMARALESQRPDLAAVASTLQTGRRELGVRAFVVAADLTEAVAGLRAGRPGRTGSGGKTGFLFPGQTARYPGLGQAMYARFPAYRHALDRYARVVRAYGVDPLEAPKDAGTDYWQPVLVCHQLALLTLLREHGIDAAHTVGHSLGEFTAAVAHGVFEPEPVLRAVAERGRLMADTAAGSMLSVRADEEQALRLCRDGVSVAALNGPDRCVLSGPAAAVATVAASCSDLGWEHAYLPTDRAFHSESMDPVLTRMRTVMEELTKTAATGSGVWISTVTGRTEALGITHDPDYWVRQVREPVRFSAAIDSLARQAEGPLLEVGAGGDLTYLAGFVSSAGKRAVAVQGRTADDEVRAYLGAVGVSWSMGVPVSWSKLEPRRRTPLPPHPMEGRDHGALLVGSETSTAVDRPREPEARVATEDSVGEAAPEAVRTGAVLGIFQDALGLSTEKLDGPFLALGGDSLAAVQVVGRLRDEQGVTVEMAELLSSPSVSQLAAELADRQGGEEGLTEALTSVLAEIDAGGGGSKNLGAGRSRAGEDVR